MRAIHLNYHEVTKDPRVLKECSSLADRGVGVTVVCALEPGFEMREKTGDIDVRRIAWTATSDVSADYVESLRSFEKAYPIIHEKLMPFARYNDVIRKISQEAKAVIGQGVEDFDILAYKKNRGANRIIQKYKLRFQAYQIDKIAKQEKYADDIRTLDVPSMGRSRHPLRNFRYRQKEYIRDLYQAKAFFYDVKLRKLEFEHGADIVHAHDIYTLPGGVALAKRLGARLVYDAHEFEIERAANMPPEGNRMVDAIEQDCLDHVDALITVSEGLRKLYSERFAKRDPLVISNAPEVSIAPRSTEQVKADRAAFRKRLGVSDDTPIVSFTGWVQRERRGMDKVVEALALIPSFHLVVLGPRHKTDDAWLMNLAKQFGVADRTHLLPGVHHSEVVPSIASCDVSIVPFQDVTLSYRFAMPNKLFEGVFAGLPVCVSDLPDMRDFVESLGRGRVMDQTDPQSIADTLSYLYEHRKDYEMSEEERTSLVREHSWSAQADKLENLYLELCGKRQTT